MATLIRRLQRASLLAATLLVLATLARAQPAEPPAPLVIASEGARPPFNYLDSNGELAGFEIDLARDICARLKRACTFVALDWDALLPGLQSRQADAVLAALEINDERRASVAFSLPYVRMPATFVVTKTSALANINRESLSGKTIGLEEGSTSQTLLEESFKGIASKSYASLEEAMLDLAEGKVDAVLADKLAAADFLTTRREGQCCRMLADAPRDPAIFGEGIAIALRKGDTSLRESIDAALQAMFDDGTFMQLRARYFDFPIR